MTKVLSPAETESVARTGTEIKLTTAIQEKIPIRNLVEVLVIFVAMTVCQYSIRSNGVKTPLVVVFARTTVGIMNLLVILLVLMLLFGGGGFYLGGPLVGGGGFGLILLILLVLFFTGCLSRR